MKKIILTLVLFLGFSSMCSAYLEERLQCEVQGDYVQVFLGRDQKLKCMDYVRTLEGSIKLLYQDMLTVEKYIYSNQDVVYWKDIYARIESNILSNEILILSILRHMETFESNLFRKLKEYILYHIQPYKNKIYTELSQLNNYDFSKMEDSEFIVGLIKRKIEIEEDLVFIKEFEVVEDMEGLVLLLPRFFKLARKLGL